MKKSETRAGDLRLYMIFCVIVDNRHLLDYEIHAELWIDSHDDWYVPVLVMAEYGSAWLNVVE